MERAARGCDCVKFGQVPCTAPEGGRGHERSKLSAVLTIAALFMMVRAVSPASAQVHTGRVDAVVVDATGGHLPGVMVSLRGQVIQTQTTDSQGETHFLNLPVGTYAVKADLSGFNTCTNNNVVVAVGASTALNLKMVVAGQVEAVEVTAALPIADTRARPPPPTSTATNCRTSVGAGTPGGHADGALHLCQSRQSRGSAIGAQSVFLKRQLGVGQQLRRRWRAGHRHVVHVVGVLLRLRHVPGGIGHDGRGRCLDDEPRRVAQSGDQARHERLQG